MSDDVDLIFVKPIMIVDEVTGVGIFMIFEIELAFRPRGKVCKITGDIRQETFEIAEN